MSGHLNSRGSCAYHCTLSCTLWAQATDVPEFPPAITVQTTVTVQIINANVGSGQCPCEQCEGLWRVEGMHKLLPCLVPLHLAGHTVVQPPPPPQDPVVMTSPTQFNVTEEIGAPPYDILYNFTVQDQDLQTTGFTYQYAEYVTAVHRHVPSPGHHPRLLCAFLELAVERHAYCVPCTLTQWDWGHRERLLHLGEVHWPNLHQLARELRADTGTPGWSPLVDLPRFLHVGGCLPRNCWLLLCASSLSCPRYSGCQCLCWMARGSLSPCGCPLSSLTSPRHPCF